MHEQVKRVEINVSWTGKMTYESGRQADDTDGRLRGLRHIEEVVEQGLVVVESEQVKLIQHEQDWLGVLSPYKNARQSTKQDCDCRTHLDVWNTRLFKTF